MLKFTRQADFARKVMTLQTARPMGALLFIDPEYPSSSTTYKISLTITEIGIYVTGQAPFLVNYVNKSVKQVASELNNSPFPIEVRAIADIQYLKAGELLVSGASIPTGFSPQDRSHDGKGCIVRAKRWAASIKNIASIQVKEPYQDASVLPWWPRIIVGDFVQSQNGIHYKFGVPEYTQQSWSTKAGFPFQDVNGEQVNFIGQNRIKLRRSPVYWKGNNIVITNNDGSRVFNSSAIKDVDKINGIVYLNDGITIPKDSLVYYTYTERSYLYKHINVNAHFSQNPSLIDRYVVFYALPISSTSGIERTRGIYHSVGNSIPEAINNIDNAAMEEPIAILGAMHISPTVKERDINIVDTRSFGGGLRDDKYGEQAQNRYPVTQYFNDLSTYDGIPYHGSAAIVVELPNQLTSVMTLDEIKRATKKFVAKGIYTIIDFVDGRTYWKQQDDNADVSMVRYKFTSLGSEDRINYASFDSTLAGSGVAQDLSIATPWEYSYDSAAYRGESLSGSLDTSVSTSVGSTGAWYLSVAHNASDFGYLTRSNSDLLQTPNGSYIEEDFGYFKGNQVISVDVKQGTSKYFGIHFIDEDTGQEFGENFRWIAGIPASYSSTAISTRYIRDDWWRCSVQVSAAGDNLKHKRNIALRPVSSGEAAVGTIANHIGSGTYFANIHIKDGKGITKSQYVPSTYHLDIPSYNVVSKLSKSNRSVGLTGEVLGFIDYDVSLPTDLTTGFDGLTYGRFPALNSRNEVTLSPGVGYYVKYLKGGPTSRFFWEELDNNGRWIKKSHIDERPILDGTLSAGKIVFNNRSAGMIRNFSGFSPVHLEDSISFGIRVGNELNEIVSDLTELAFTGFGGPNYYFAQQQNVVDILSGTVEWLIGDSTEIYPKTLPVMRGILTNYDSLSNSKLYSSYYDRRGMIARRGNFFADATRLAKQYPARFITVLDRFAGHDEHEYNFIDELYIYSKYLKDAMNEHYAIAGTSSINNRPDLANLQSGVFRLGQQLLSVASVANGNQIGTDIKGPYYDPFNDVEVRPTGDFSEMSTNLSNMYLASEYIKAFAALYATQDRPTIVQNNGSVSLQFAMNPLMVASSGIAHVIHHWDRYMTHPKYKDEFKDVNWIYSYNHLTHYAANFIDNISSAFDSIYYGNSEWAGFSGLIDNGLKYGPSASDALTYNAVTGYMFRRDEHFDEAFVWPNRRSTKLYVALDRMVSGYKDITDSVRPLLHSTITRGGVTSPELAKLVKSYLWIPKHAALNESYFTKYYDPKDVQLFEDCMTSLVKGMFSEDGRCIESKTFKHEYVGKAYLPQDIFYHCMEGADYYDLLNDTANKNRWLAISQGIYNTVTGLYKEAYGYPVEIIQNGSSGDLGSRIVPAMCRMIGYVSREFTDRELNSITGSMDPRVTSL